MAKNPIKKQQYDKIINHLESDTTLREKTKDKYLKIFTFLYYTGARINEATKIKGNDIKQIIEKGKLRLLTSKTGWI